LPHLPGTRHGRESPLQPLAPLDIRRILAVTDALGVHRESVRVPIARRGTGSLRVTEAGHVEIVAPEGEELESWLAALPGQLRALDLGRVRRVD
jgi:hypothetical protein